MSLDMEAAPKRRITIEYNLLPWQAKARALRAKFPNVVLNCGVLSGKTDFGAVSCLEEMSGLGPREMGWWVASEDFQIKRFWAEFRPRAQRWGWRCRDAPHCYAKTTKGAELHGVTAKNLNALSAYHPKVLFGDEIAKVGDTAWNLIYIRMAKARRVLLMSTPRPNHWAKLVRWGKERLDKRWAQITVTTEEAGIVDKATIGQYRRTLPEDLFRQEFLAELVADAGSVFRKVYDCAIGEPEEPKPGKHYEVMYDPAKHRDFAVVSVWDGMRQVRAERWQKIDYAYQTQRVVEIAAEYNRAPIIYDRTGPGEAVGEMLEQKADRIGVDVIGIVFDNASKTALVNAACLAFERGEITLIDREQGEPYDIFVDELVAFERTRSRTGLTYSYAAPPGGHDDCVTNVLLRMAGRKEPRVRTLGPDGDEEDGDAQSDEDGEEPDGGAKDREGPRDRFLDDD
jgi:hypothetical protein